jgi:hypothetical protein
MVPALIDEAAFFLFLIFGTPAVSISCAIGFIAGVFKIVCLLFVIWNRYDRFFDELSRCVRTEGR